MTEKEINQIIQEEGIQKIIQEEEFYFSKGQEALQRWLSFSVSEQLKEDIIRLSSDYAQFQEIAEINPEIGKIKDMLFEIISYCDIRAKEKHIYNRYDDKRCLAEASVRMGDWVAHLVKYKLVSKKETSPSVLNAIEYLLNPSENSPMLSEKMRESVSVNFLGQAYSKEHFISNLKSFFSPYSLSTKNPENYTLLLSNLVYNFQGEWKEEVIGLMASDGTGWHEEELEFESNYSNVIVWNSSKPVGGSETLNFLRKINQGGRSFPLYVSSGNLVRYRIDIKDFAINQEELEAAGWDSLKTKYYHKNFSDFKDDDGKKKAKIIFLAESIKKIDPKPVTEFRFYKKYQKPVQHNLAPIRMILTEDKIVDMNSKKGNEQKENLPLNQIFFGPPGTGKTYNTINEALRIVGVEFEGKTREEVKAEFDKKLVEGQIVFTTFHQSMNYEEFIEGIKPKIVDGEGEEQKLEYEIKSGVFKKLSIEASFELAKSKMSKETEVTLDFAMMYEQFIEKAEEELLNNEPVKLETKSGGTVLLDRISPQGNVVIKHPNGSREYIVSKARLTKLNTAFENLNEVNNIHDEFREVIGGSNSSAYWSVLNAIKQGSKGRKTKTEEKEYSFTDKIEVVKKMTREEYRTSTGKNFVLIIDEINRGNVSQIFGELITLIESDKRLGRDEELKVTLPYSGERFGVPPNLYIVGTMNTADRSVEALDTALRRRFSFREMPPIPRMEELSYEYAGIKASEILITINRRIEKLLDRDHLIGHSFFILSGNETAESKLIQTFYQSLIPLLQEYFFGDYAKIGAILGQGFIRRENGIIHTEFALGYESEGDNQREVFHIVDYREGFPGNQYKLPEMTFEKAIKQLMNLSTE